MAALICSYEWSCDQALSVAWCESHLDPWAENGDYAGVFQLSRHWHEWRFVRRGWSWEQAFDSSRNVAIAFEIWQESGWGAWSCEP